MPTASSFDYTIVRVVPRVERGEFVNAGVVLFCRTRRFLGAQIDLDARRLLALAPGIDLDEVRRHLDAIPLICAGGPDAGPLGQLPQAERFHWLVAPRSAMIQMSPVHVGLCTDPRSALDHLVATLVRVDEAAAQT
jgi:Protein of unknown function (DUF3037)